jgi:hypothetical protein
MSALAIIRAGGVICGIDSNDGGLIREIRERWHNFQSTGKPEVRITFTAKKTGYSRPEIVKLRERYEDTITPGVQRFKGPAEKRYVRVSEGRISLNSKSVRGSFDRGIGRGAYSITYSWSAIPYVAEALRVSLAFYNLRRGGLLLHSSAIKRRGNFFVFTAGSTGGKSTIVKLLPGSIVLNDEFNVIRCGDKGGRVYSTPFGGDHTPNNLGGYVSRLFFIRKSKESSASKIEVGEAIREIIQNEYLVMTLGNSKDSHKIFPEVTENAIRFLRNVDYRRLDFNLTSRLMEHIE